MSGETPEASRAAGLRRMYAFVGSAGRRYTQSRNFDFGPDLRNNVSVLSPYVRHRLVSEQEVLDAVLRQHSMPTAQKFVEEVFWRGYFKGWMEQHPAVWEDYRQAVSQQLRALESDEAALDGYAAATEGRTGIECFDFWVRELIDTGYLHNHARMWFASIWVYTLQLPWPLGADFFLRHLLDGDPASNTLSWRWVCGLHTRGKTYLARVSNIANYTDNRFRPEGQLAIKAPPLVETRVFPVQSIPAPQVLSGDENFGLLVTEEDCSPEILLGDAKPLSVIGALATRDRSPLPVSQRVTDFATGAVADAVKRTSQAYGVNGSLRDAEDWGGMLIDWATQHHLTSIVTPYAPIGPVAERLAAARGLLERYGVRLLQLRRPYDSAVWPHAGKGYFKLRQQIPVILDRLELHNPAPPPQSLAG